MICREDRIDQMGLFTFYREQEEFEQNLKREKKAKKNKNKRIQRYERQQEDNKNEFKVTRVTPTKQISMIKKNIELNQYLKKVKLMQPKQRLIESVIDLSSEINAKSKINQPQISLSQQNLQYLKKIQAKFRNSNQDLLQTRMFQDTSILSNQMKVKSLDTKHIQQKQSSAQKSITNSNTSAQLPHIRLTQNYSEMSNKYIKHKKMRSHLVEYALRSKNEIVIKNAREYIKQSKSQREEKTTPHQIQINNVQYDEPVEQYSWQKYNEKQSKLINILKRFKKR